MLNVSYKDLLGHVDILVQLQREFPPGVVLDIINDQGGDDGRFAPFRLKEKLTGRRYPGGPLFGPFKIRFIINDHFQFIGQRKDLR